jgi:hypothetical protein
VSLVARVGSQCRDQSGDCCLGSQPLFLSPPLLRLRAATAAPPSIAPGISVIIHPGQDTSTPHRCLRRRSSTSRSRSRQRRCDCGGQLRRVPCSESIDCAEATLRCALPVTIGGSRLPISAQQVCDAVVGSFSVNLASLAVAPTEPKDFILFLPDGATVDRVHNGGAPLHRPAFSPSWSSEVSQCMLGSSPRRSTS